MTLATLKLCGNKAYIDTFYRYIVGIAEIYYIDLGRERLFNVSSCVRSRGFPQACTRPALSRPIGHRFGPVQASPTICASEPVADLA